MTTEKDIKRRNLRVEKLFFYLGYDVMAFGNPNTPAMILNKKIILSCYVKNFDLIFTDQPRGGKELFRIKLTDELTFTDQFLDLFKDWISNCDHRECYTVAVANSNLKLAGYNFTDLEKSEDSKYPVFSELNYKIYFDRNYVQEIVDKYSNENVQLEIA